MPKPMLMLFMLVAQVQCPEADGEGEGAGAYDGDDDGVVVDELFHDGPFFGYSWTPKAHPLATNPTLPNLGVQWLMPSAHTRKSPPRHTGVVVAV